MSGRRGSIIVEGVVRPSYEQTERPQREPPPRTLRGWGGSRWGLSVVRFGAVSRRSLCGLSRRSSRTLFARLSSRLSSLVGNVVRSGRGSWMVVRSRRRCYEERMGIVDGCEERTRCCEERTGIDRGWGRCGDGVVRVRSDDVRFGTVSRRSLRALDVARRGHSRCGLLCRSRDHGQPTNRSHDFNDFWRLCAVRFEWRPPDPNQIMKSLFDSRAMLNHFSRTLSGKNHETSKNSLPGRYCDAQVRNCRFEGMGNDAPPASHLAVDPFSRSIPDGSLDFGRYLSSVVFRTSRSDVPLQPATSLRTLFSADSRRQSRF